MIKKIILSVALAVLCVAAPAHAATIGKAAPDFKAKTTMGEDFSLAKQKGKIVVLEWTNHDCPFVKKHYGANNMQTLQRKYTGMDVVWVSVISSAEGKQGYLTDEEANGIATKNRASPSYIIRDTKGKIGKLYNAKTTPSLYVIDKKGNLAYESAIDSISSVEPDDIKKATNYVDVALTELEAGKPVTTSSVPSYGCSVKY